MVEASFEDFDGYLEQQGNDMGGSLARGIGLMRARARIGLKNLA